MLKGFGITLGAALLASLVIQDSKGVIDVIALNIPRVDAEQSTADETPIMAQVFFTCGHNRAPGPIYTHLGLLYLHLPTNSAIRYP